nr:MAG TPA_asm: hypothetical protein [Caudoviricetes sp.]
MMTGLFATHSRLAANRRTNFACASFGNLVPNYQARRCHAG